MWLPAAQLQPRTGPASQRCAAALRAEPGGAGQKQQSFYVLLGRRSDSNISERSQRMPFRKQLNEPEKFEASYIIWWANLVISVLNRESFHRLSICFSRDSLCQPNRILGKRRLLLPLPSLHRSYVEYIWTHGAEGKGKLERSLSLASETRIPFFTKEWKSREKVAQLENAILQLPREITWCKGRQKEDSEK